MQDLLSNFNGLVDSYAEHREYIERAQAQASKFSKAIIEKVVLDHEVKSSAVADQILPVVPELEAKIDEIDAEVSQINEEKGGADEKMEEMQLRQLIGELTDDEFETESKDLREKLEVANGRLESLESDRGQLQGALDRWVELATGADQATGLRAAAEPEATPEEEAPVEVEEAPADPDDATNQHQVPVVEENPGTGTHSSTEHVQEDVSAVFDDAASEAVDVGAADDEDDDEAIEAGEDVDFGFDDDEVAGGEVELNLVDGGADDGEAGADEIGIDLDAVDQEAEAGSDDDAPEEVEDEARRALLLYQEGTAEEQIYPFTGEVLTIGRGRDNDIQIKNDSKVSRFHCKLFRRSGNFYIEDNKSSNGTLVNGELITERRLFGGEEVIIGETFFRFRIM